jgi:hypothetical protein
LTVGTWKGSNNLAAFKEHAKVQMQDHEFERGYILKNI